MSAWIGDFRTGVTVRKMWNSNAVAGESITRATNGTVSVYKDGGTTQSTTGVTDTEDFDSLTGVHLVAIDTSADGTFYSAASDFEVVLSAATIDSKTINATLFSFSLQNRSPPTANENADAILDRSAGVETNRTVRQAMRLMLAVLCGKASGLATTTAVYRDTNDSKDRVSATVDADGNRSAVTLDAT